MRTVNCLRHFLHLWTPGRTGDFDPGLAVLLRTAKSETFEVATFRQNVGFWSVPPALWRGAATSHFRPRGVYLVRLGAFAVGAGNAIGPSLGLNEVASLLLIGEHGRHRGEIQIGIRSRGRSLLARVGLVRVVGCRFDVLARHDSSPVMGEF